MCVCLYVVHVRMYVCLCGGHVMLFLFRQLEVCYPQFPNEKEFLNHIQELGLEDGELRILSRFTIGIEKQRLDVMFSVSVISILDTPIQLVPLLTKTGHLELIYLEKNITISHKNKKF